MIGYIVMGQTFDYDNSMEWPVKVFIGEDADAAAADLATKANEAAEETTRKKRDLIEQRRLFGRNHYKIKRAGKEVSVDYGRLTLEEYNKKILEFMTLEEAIRNPFDTTRNSGTLDSNYEWFEVEVEHAQKDTEKKN